MPSCSNGHSARGSRWYDVTKNGDQSRSVTICSGAGNRLDAGAVGELSEIDWRVSVAQCWRSPWSNAKIDPLRIAHTQTRAWTQNGGLGEVLVVRQRRKVNGQPVLGSCAGRHVHVDVAPPMKLQTGTTSPPH